MTPPLPHGSSVSHVRFSPDGRRILTGGWNGLARVWDAQTGRPLSEWLQAGNVISSVGFDSTGKHIVVANQRSLARVWNLPEAPIPVPPWFTLLAEAVAGSRLTAQGNLELFSRQEFDGSAWPVAPHKSSEFYERLSEWFLAQRAERSRSPF